MENTLSMTKFSGNQSTLLPKFEETITPPKGWAAFMREGPGKPGKSTVTLGECMELARSAKPAGYVEPSYTSTKAERRRRQRQRKACRKGPGLLVLDSDDDE